jgi:hypothetical protein
MSKQKLKTLYSKIQKSPEDYPKIDAQGWFDIYEDWHHAINRPDHM